MRVPQASNSGGVPAEVPQRYPDLVQLLSTLFPTMRIHRFAEVPTAVANLKRLWQRRVYSLRDEGWGPLVDPVPTRNRLMKMVNCMPTFVIQPPGTPRWLCNTPLVCPYCFARGVRDVWLAVDRAFFPDEPSHGSVGVPVRESRAVEAGESPELASGDWSGRAPRSEFDLVLRTASGPSSTDMLPRFFAARTRVRPRQIHALLEPTKVSARSWGAFESVGVSYKEASWWIDIHQALLLSSECPLGLLESSGIIKVTRLVRPSRRDVMRAVARAMRYPRFLIDPAIPGERVRAYLESRGRFRSRAMFGAFRNKEV